MLKLKFLVAVVAVLGLATFGTALTAEFYANGDRPAPAAASLSETRYQVMCDLIDRRTSLLEAAAAFHELNGKSAIPAETLIETYPGDTEGERACRQVLAHVRHELEWRRSGSTAESSEASDPAVAVLARLEAEFAAAKGEDGTVRLPQDAE